MADTVDLAEFLANNSQRNVIRIFARIVEVKQLIKHAADLSTSPLDLRIDCQQLVFSEAASIDLSGNSGADCKSYAPDQHRAGEPGQPGYAGGDITINALQIVGKANFSCEGGSGGKGQDGYPGWPGAPGADGIHFTEKRHIGFRGVSTYTVDNPGTPPKAGSPGTAGTDGGRGGEIGRAGHLSVCHANPVVISYLLSALPGLGGKGGKGGRGGPPGKPTMIIPDGGSVHDPRDSSASEGPAGVDGKDGQLPQQVHDTIILNPSTPTAVYTAMQADALPQSLRLRANMLFDVVIANAMRPGLSTSRADVLAQLQWLLDLAQPDQCNYPEILLRFEHLDAIQPSKVFKNYLGMKPEVYNGGLDQLAKVGSPQFATERPRFAAMAQHYASVDTAYQDVLKRLNIPQSGVQSTAFLAALSARVAARRVNKSDKTILNDIEMVSIGTDGVADAAACETLEGATLEEVCLSEAAMGPEGLAAAAVTALAFLVFNNVFHWSLEDTQRIQRERYKADLAKYRTDMQGWQNAETQREKMDGPNSVQSDAEGRVRGEREKADERDKDYTDTIKFFGLKYIGILTDIKEVADDSGDYGVFDALLLPLIDDLPTVALFIAATYRWLTVMITAKLPAGAPAMKLGDWYIIDIAASNIPGDQSFIEPALSILTPVDAPAPFFARKLLLLPGINVGIASISPAPLLLSQGLEFALRLNQISNKNFVSPALTPPAPLKAVQNVTDLTTYNVGQGAFHTFAGPPAVGSAAVPAFAADLGGSTSNSLSASVNSSLAAIVSGHLPIVMSHWDLDHYRLFGGVAGMLVQGASPVLGPSVLINGQTLVNLVTAIASHGAGHLYLVGSRVAVVLAQNANICRNQDLIGVPANFRNLIPANILVTTTTLTDASSNTRDRNNVEAIVVKVAGTVNTVMLPGDASFSYIVAAAKSGLTLLEATHHGSIRSILKSNGASSGTAADNDIPVGGSHVVFSTDHKFGHGIAMTGPLYSAHGWVNQVETYAGSDVAIKIS